jgi:hypothetical protein
MDAILTCPQKKINRWEKKKFCDWDLNGRAQLGQSESRWYSVLSTSAVKGSRQVYCTYYLVALLRSRDSWAYHAMGAGFAQTLTQQTPSKKRNGMTSGKKPSLRPLIHFSSLFTHSGVCRPRSFSCSHCVDSRYIRRVMCNHQPDSRDSIFRSRWRHLAPGHRIDLP